MIGVKSAFEPRKRGQDEYEQGLEYFRQRNYKAAKPRFRTSLAHREVALGIEHRDTVRTRLMLAATLHRVQEYNEAAQLFRQKYDEAEELLRETVQQQGRALGAEHKDTLYSKYWLGCTLHAVKKYDEAEELFREVIEQRGRVLGPEHKTTLESKHTLAQILIDKRNYGEAERLTGKLVQQQEQSLAAEHEDTVGSRRLLPELERALSDVERTLSPAEFPSIMSVSPSIMSPGSAYALPKYKTETTGNLSHFFGGETRTVPYTDSEISQITHLLRREHPQWSQVARTYIVLRSIGCLSLISSFIDAGFTDYWFPVGQRSLPASLHPSQRSKFMSAQRLIMTQSMDLEKGENGQHCRFRREDPIPLEVKGVLGSGGFGQVDRVVSLISFKEYARKRVPRREVFGSGQEHFKMFIAEIEVLKRLRHRHVTEFVGSYTDPKYIALLMSPVAEMDLHTYLQRADESNRGELRTFFGCLARALEYLHEKDVRHKDITPRNILVDHGNVLFSDFGLSYDFAGAEGSTTVGMVKAMTPRYCAPEVAMHAPRNTSSDIWSLGVVFLEMSAVLKGKTVDKMYTFLEERGSQLAFVRTNPQGVGDLVDDLRNCGASSDNAPFDWIQDMLIENGKMRPTAASLVTTITAASRANGGAGSFCGICCMYADDEFSDDSDD